MYFSIGIFLYKIFHYKETHEEFAKRMAKILDNYAIKNKGAYK